MSNLDGVVDVADRHAVVSHVGDLARSASALQITRQCRCSAGPDLDARTVRGVGHGDVGDVNVLDDVDFAGVLAERANRDAVGAVADEVLDDDIGRVGLEGDAIVAVIDVRILDHDVAAAVCVPAIGILGGVAACAGAGDIDVGEDHVSGVGDECVPLRAVAELQILDGRAFEADGSEEDWTKDVDILGVEVVPSLTVAVQGSTSVDVDVLATELEKGGGVLEGLEEGVLLPVVGVIGELNRSLYVCRKISIRFSYSTSDSTHQDQCA